MLTHAGGLTPLAAAMWGDRDLWGRVVGFDTARARPRLRAPDHPMLSMPQLAARDGVSRQAVSKAVRRLAAQGLNVERDPLGRIARVNAAEYDQMRPLRRQRHPNAAAAAAIIRLPLQQGNSTMTTTTITLSAPIDWRDTKIDQLVFREPVGRDVFKLGEPSAWARSREGMIYTAEKDDVILAYLETCLVEPKEPLILGQLALTDALKAKAALMDFFAKARMAASSELVES